MSFDSYMTNRAWVKSPTGTSDKGDLTYEAEPREIWGRYESASALSRMTAGKEERQRDAFATLSELKKGDILWFESLGSAPLPDTDDNSAARTPADIEVAETPDGLFRFWVAYF